MMSIELADPPVAGKTPWLKALVAGSAFLLVSWPLSLVCQALFPGIAWLPHTILKVVLLAVSVAATWAGRRSLVEIGFRRPTRKLVWRAIGLGLLLGSITTLVMLGIGAQGLRPVLENFSFGQIVVTVWLLSSFSEEVFCRGWFQTWVLGSQHSGARRSELLVSAILFASMHLTLLFVIDVLSAAIIITMVAVLGWIASWARARSGSIYPAIAAHVAFNVGGLIGGIIYAIFTAKPPG